MTHAETRRQWMQAVEITVNDPLVMEPPAFGKVLLGARVKGVLTLRNRGNTPLGPLTLRSAGFAQLDERQIELTVPGSTPTIPAQGTVRIPLSLTVSPVTKSRGKFQGELSVTRGTLAQTVNVPVEICDAVAGGGTGGGNKAVAGGRLTVAPDPILLKARSGAVVRFPVTVKSGALPAARVSSERGTWQAIAGQALTGTAEIRWQNAGAFDAGKRARGQGFLVAPSRPGTYQMTITIQSGTDQVRVPLELTVSK